MLKQQILTEWFSAPFWKRIAGIYLFGDPAKNPNLVPYQRRAKHAGQCGVEVEGGKVPTQDWFLNLQILTSGGFR
jgi:hypothetical protein